MDANRSARQHLCLCGRDVFETGSPGSGTRARADAGSRTANDGPARCTPAPQPRVVSHEGVVRAVGSIAAPTKFELYDPATDVNINYLYTTSPNLDLSRYVNMRIIVTGEEGLDARWKDTPLINIQSIQVISQNAVQNAILRSPRQSQAH